MKVALAFVCVVVCLVVCHSCIMYSCHSLDVCVFCCVSFMLCYLQGQGGKSSRSTSSRRNEEVKARNFTISEKVKLLSCTLVIVVVFVTCVMLVVFMGCNPICC